MKACETEFRQAWPAELQRREKGDELMPVLIVGVPRSGTSWVGRVLKRTHDVSYVGEPDNEGKEPYAFRAKRSLGRFPTLAPKEDAPLYEQLWDDALAGRVRGKTVREAGAKYLLKKVTRPELRAAYSHRQPRVSMRLRAIDALASRPTVQQPGRNVVVKSVFAPMTVEWIDARWHPEILVVARNPYNVLASWVELGYKQFDLHLHDTVRSRYAEPLGIPPLHSGASPLQHVAWEVGLLTAVLQNAVAEHPNWRVVSHEELCMNPEDHFKKMTAELGLEWSATADSFLKESNRPGTGYDTKRVASEQPDRWKKRLSEEQVDEIDSVLAGFPTKV